NNNDTMTLSTISAVCASFNFGTIDLGDKAYVSGAAVTETGSLGYDGTTHTLTLTLTSANGSLGTKTGSTQGKFTPSGITGRSGVAISGTTNSANGNPLW